MPSSLCLSHLYHRADRMEQWRAPVAIMLPGGQTVHIFNKILTPPYMQLLQCVEKSLQNFSEIRFGDR